MKDYFSVITVSCFSSYGIIPEKTEQRHCHALPLTVESRVKAWRQRFHCNSFFIYLYRRLNSNTSSPLHETTFASTFHSLMHSLDIKTRCSKPLPLYLVSTSQSQSLSSTYLASTSHSQPLSSSYLESTSHLNLSLPLNNLPIVRPFHQPVVLCSLYMTELSG